MSYDINCSTEWTLEFRDIVESFICGNQTIWSQRCPKPFLPANLSFFFSKNETELLSPVYFAQEQHKHRVSKVLVTAVSQALQHFNRELPDYRRITPDVPSGSQHGDSLFRKRKLFTIVLCFLWYRTSRKLGHTFPCHVWKYSDGVFVTMMVWKITLALIMTLVYGTMLASG